MEIGRNNVKAEGNYGFIRAYAMNQSSLKFGSEEKNDKELSRTI